MGDVCEGFLLVDAAFGACCQRGDEIKRLVNLGLAGTTGEERLIEPGDGGFDGPGSLGMSEGFFGERCGVRFHGLAIE